MLLDPDCAGAKGPAEPLLAKASGVEVADVDGTKANAFEETDSESEPSKSTSTFFEVTGAAEKKHKNKSMKVQ